MATGPGYSIENEQRIKIFLSWSGKKSQELATLFKTYVTDILPKIDFYFSPDDLKGGEKWRQSIEEGLNNNTYGIIFLTPSNLTSKWVYFEAGAISKSTKQAKILPLLYQIDINEIGQPFSDYQCKMFSKDSILTTIYEMNECQANVYKLPKDTIKRNFDRLSDEIQSNIEQIDKINEVNEDNSLEIEDANLLESDDKINEILQILREQSSDNIFKIDNNSNITYESINLFKYLNKNSIFLHAKNRDDLAIILGKVILDKIPLSKYDIEQMKITYELSTEELQSIIENFPG